MFLNGIRFLYRQVLEWPGFDVAIPIPKKAQRLLELLTRAEVGSMLSAWGHPQHRLMFTRGYGCGLRRSEGVSVKVRDLDGEGQRLRIEPGKGAKGRLVPLSDTLVVPLHAYWRQCRLTLWLFPGRPLTEGLSMSGVQKAFTPAQAHAGVAKLGGLHALRHA